MLASNKRLKLTAPSVTLYVFRWQKCAFGPQLKRSVGQITMKFKNDIENMVLA